MSGALVDWTPARRAARSALMRAKWADPAFHASQSKRLADRNRSPAHRAAARRTITAWNERRKSDVDADAKWRAALGNANRRPAKRKSASEHMRKRHARPEMRDHIRSLGFRCRNMRLNSLANRKRRGGAVPDYLEGSYRALRRKGLTAREAYLAIKPFFRKPEP